MAMTVGELKEALDNFGDHLPVFLYEREDGEYHNIESVEYVGGNINAVTLDPTEDPFYV